MYVSLNGKIRGAYIHLHELYLYEASGSSAIGYDLLGGDYKMWGCIVKLTNCAGKIISPLHYIDTYKDETDPTCLFCILYVIRKLATLGSWPLIFCSCLCCMKCQKNYIIGKLESKSTE